MAVIVTPCAIGEYSYAGEHTHISQLTKIGKFCSIANLCTIGAQNHRTDCLTTWPLQGVEIKATTIIGNDVWIGASSVIIAGVVIGDGAVIGAGSIVTKDIPPYGIAYGNPAKVHGYRFDSGTIADLLNLKWWDLPLETIKSLPIHDPKACINALRIQSASRVLQHA